MKYIDAEKLISEINGIIAAVKVKNRPDELGSIEQCMAAAEIEALNIALDCIKELQQEKPEVDLEKEITRWLDKGDITDTRFDDYDDADIERTARHFYELGLNARREE